MWFFLEGGVCLFVGGFFFWFGFGFGFFIFEPRFDPERYC